MQLSPNKYLLHALASRAKFITVYLNLKFFHLYGWSIRRFSVQVENFVKIPIDALQVRDGGRNWTHLMSGSWREVSGN